MSDVVAKPPKYLRTPPARTEAAVSRVERRGGYRNAGVIRGVSVITRGEALGHDLWVDGEMLEQVADAINLRNKGVKSRFTHPSLSGDGLGKFVGRIMDAEVVGDQVIADQHFSEAGHKTPDGDLASYLMDLAEEEPESYGLSIVFSHDAEAAAAFAAEHLDDSGRFRSPDERNANNLPHARIAELRAADAVDEPAANPNGLFHRENELLTEAEGVAAFALGLADEKPEAVCLGLDADRVRGFVTRFLTSRKLEIKPMTEETNTPADDAVVETPAVDESVTEEPETVEVADTADAGEQAEAPQEAPVVAANDRAEASRFRDAFGVRGLEWFADGLTFEEANAKHVETLQAENAELRDRLAKLSSGESEPVEFNAEDKPGAKPKGRGLAARIRIAGQAAN